MWSVFEAWKLGQSIGDSHMFLRLSAALPQLDTPFSNKHSRNTSRLEKKCVQLGLDIDDK